MKRMLGMRVAIVGLGNAGYTLHLPALARIEAATVVGGCDLDRQRRDRAAARFNIPVFEEFEAMLGSRPDLVIIGTPPQSHASYCLRSLAAGAHVICEKPFVSSLEEADQVLAAAAASKRTVALNHEFREMPIFRAVRDAVARESGDGPVFAQVWQMMDLPPRAEAGWRGQMLQRTLFEAGAHLVDFVLALFGDKPSAVQAWTSSCGVLDGGTDAVALATLEFSRGRLAHITQNRLCKGDTQYFEIRADTTSASFRASFGGRARLSAGLHRTTRPHVRIEYGASGVAWCERGHARAPLARNPKRPEMMATRVLFEKTIAALAAGVAPPVTGQDGRVVLEVIAACYHAAAIGRRVALAPDTAAEFGSVRLGDIAGAVPVAAV